MTADAPLHQRVSAQAARVPTSVAVVDERRVLRYADVESGATLWSYRLAAGGVTPGVRVGLLLEHSLELPVVVLAALRAGAVCVPLDPTLPPPRLATLLEQARPTVVVTQSSLMPLLPRGDGARVVVIDERWTRSEAPSASAAVAPDSPAFVLFTSGSTSAPKGVVLSHRAVAARAWRDAAFVGAAGDCMSIMKTGIGHSPFLGELFAPLLNGCYIAVAPPEARRDARHLSRLITTHRLRAISMSTSVLEALLDSVRAGECADLRQVSIGGEVVSDDLPVRFFRRFPDARLNVAYGTTESGHATEHVCHAGERLHRNIGRPIPQASAYCLDDALHPVAAGAHGELYLGGVRLATGYLDDVVLTGQRFISRPGPDGTIERLYRSGDRARLRPDGDLEFCGRLDQQIKLRGYRIEPEEIEAVLRTHPSVTAAAVVIREAEYPESLVAYVVPAGRVGSPPHALREFVAAYLPATMVPAEVRFVASLPLTTSGKLNRRRLSSEDVVEPPAIRLVDGRLVFGAEAGLPARLGDQAVDCAAIEQALAGLAPVRRAAVVPAGDERLDVYVIPSSPGVAAAAQRAVAACMDALHVPWRVTLAPAELVDATAVFLTSEAEATVLAIWNELLHAPRLDRDARFLEAGGNSLLATMVANRIETCLGTRPGLDEVLTLTLGELAERCSG